MRVTAVLNGVSDSRRREEGVCALQDVFGGSDICICVTEAAGDAERLAANAANDSEIVIAGGGDGTVQEVVRGIVGKGAALGVLPLGSANDFARCQGLPSDPRRAVEAIAGGLRRPIDLLRANGQWLITGLGCGLQANVALGCKRYLPYMRLFGSLGRRAIYLISGLEHILLRRLPDIPMTVSLDGEEMPFRVANLCVNNQRLVGGVFLFTPEAKIDDGSLHLCVVASPVPLRRYPRTIFGALSGTLEGLVGVTARRGQRLEIHTDTPLTCYGDGEYLGASCEWTVEIKPQCLDMLGA